MKRDYVVEGSAFYLPASPLPRLQPSPLQRPSTGSPLLLAIPVARRERRREVRRLGEGAAAEKSRGGERLRLRPQLEGVRVGAEPEQEAGSLHLQPGPQDSRLLAT